MSTNPYDFKYPVRDPKMFFGRRALLKEVVDNFCAPNPRSYSLFGGRRFGKTSLLRAIQRQLRERLATGEEMCTIPIYIDLNYDIIGSRGAFFACVIRHLREMFRTCLHQVALDDEYLDRLQERIETEREPLPLFEGAFVHIRSIAFPQVGALQVVLLVDETERILGHKWAPELQSNLRALLSNRPKVQGYLGIKMAGSSDLYAKIAEAGSPLRNILDKCLLVPLSEDETRALINQPTGGVLPGPVVDEIARQTGGHPFLTQYLMHYLCQAGLSQASVETTRDIADSFSGRRDDFEDWCRGIGPVGEQIYALLHRRGEWTKRGDIFDVIPGNRLDVKKALEALSYHGLVHKDENDELFRVGAEMFRAWFKEYKLPVVVGALRPPAGGEKKAEVISYHDFELLVTPDGKIRATSEQGEEGGELRLDINEIGLTLQLVEEGRTNAQLLKRLGSRLYQGLFPADIHAHLRASMAGAEAAGCSLRLRLIFEPPQVSDLPWEFLYDADTNTFLANSIQTALARYIPVPMTRRDIKAASPPLKILVVISSPQDIMTLDVDGEERLIRAALASHLDAGRIEMDVLREATIRNINQKLREKPYCVFHFIGHGVYEDNTGYVALVDQDGSALPVDDETFSNFFLGNRSLGLIVLNACQGAATSSHQAFTGMAPHLVRRGIPAVVAMKYLIADDTAKLFADEFYRTLALGWPVDAAIQTTRNAISMEVGLDRPDFATPVLFMRAKDGVILSGL